MNSFLKFASLFIFIIACNSIEAQNNLRNDVILKAAPEKSQKTLKTTSDLKLTNKSKTKSFKSKNEYLDARKKVYLKTPSGNRFKTYLAITQEESVQGLSKVRQHEFANDEAMLFIGKSEQPRSFWMPDTYFNLDIFFLSKDLKVLNVERNVPHHPGESTPPEIYTTGTYKSTHVLELKHSKKSAEIVVGMKLILPPLLDHSEIKELVRPQQ
jgi:hypothetical protein